LTRSRLSQFESRSDLSCSLSMRGCRSSTRSFQMDRGHPYMLHWCNMDSEKMVLGKTYSGLKKLSTMLNS
jgi:hypothetical protein